MAKKLPMRRIINPVLNPFTVRRIQHEGVLLRSHSRLLRVAKGYRETFEQMRRKKLLTQKEHELELKKLENKLEFLLNGKMRQMKRLSERDPKFTHLFNRKQIERVLAEWLAKRDKQPFSVIMFDLDHFKAVNDTYGHAVGDKVLAFFSERLNEMIRKRNGWAGRFGGEEYVGAIPVSPSNAAGFLRALRRRLMADFAQKVGDSAAEAFFKQLGNMVTFSAGIASSEEASSVDEVLIKADQLVYESKRGGRDRVSYYNNAQMVQHRVD